MHVPHAEDPQYEDYAKNKGAFFAEAQKAEATALAKANEETAAATARAEELEKQNAELLKQLEEAKKAASKNGAR